jgi:uncharacterized protein
LRPRRPAKPLYGPSTFALAVMKQPRPLFQVLLLATIAVTFSIFGAASPPAESISVPRLDGWVNDTAEVLTPFQREHLSQLLSQYHRETHHQIVVLTVPTIGSESIESFSLRTANSWHLGYKGLNNGILVTLAIKERSVRIELGLGMERYITDADAKDIIASAMAPAFSKGDYYGGLRLGLSRLMDRARAFVVPADSAPPP